MVRKSRYFSRWNFQDDPTEAAIPAGIDGNSDASSDDSNTDSGSIGSYMDAAINKGKQIVNAAKDWADGAMSDAGANFKKLKDIVTGVTAEEAIADYHQWCAENGKNNLLVTWNDLKDADDCFGDLVKADVNFRYFIVACLCVYRNPEMIKDSQEGQENLGYIVDKYLSAEKSVTAIAIDANLATIDEAHSWMDSIVAVNGDVANNSTVQMVIKQVCGAEHDISVKGAILSLLKRFNGLKTAKDAEAVRRVLGGMLLSLRAITALVNLNEANKNAKVLKDAADKVVVALNKPRGDAKQKELIIRAILEGKTCHGGNSWCQSTEYSTLKFEIETAMAKDPQLLSYGVKECCALVDHAVFNDGNDDYAKSFDSLRPACDEWKRLYDELYAKTEVGKVDKVIAEHSATDAKKNLNNLVSNMKELSDFIGQKQPGQADDLVEAGKILLSVKSGESARDYLTVVKDVHAAIPFCADRGVEDLVSMANGTFSEIYDKHTTDAYLSKVANLKAKLQTALNKVGAMLINMGARLDWDNMTMLGLAFNQDSEVAAVVNSFMRLKFNSQVATSEALAAVLRGEENEDINEIIDDFLKTQSLDPAKLETARAAILDHLRNQGQSVQQAFSRARYADKLNNLRRIKIAMRRYYSACKNFTTDDDVNPANDIPEECWNDPKCKAEWERSCAERAGYNPDEEFAQNYCGGRTFSKKRRVVNPFSRYNFADDPAEEEEIIDEEAEEAAPVDEEPAEDFDEGMDEGADEGMEDEGIEDEMGAEDYAEDDMSMDEELPEEGEEEEDYDMSADEVDSGDEDFEAEDGDEDFEAEDEEEEDMYAAPAVCAPRGEDMQVGHWSDSVVDSQLDDLSQSEDADMYDSKQGELTLSAANAGEAMAMQNELATLRGINNAESNFSRRRSAVRRGNPRTATLRSLLGDKYLR